jgi:hypothetical protein
VGQLRRKQRPSGSQAAARPARVTPVAHEATLRHLSDAGISDSPVPARVLETPSGQRWLVVLIARLASLDQAGQERGGRLIVRAEPLFAGNERVRIAIVKATSLDEVDGGMLREALLRRRSGAHPKARRRV